MSWCLIIMPNVTLSFYFYYTTFTTSPYFNDLMDSIGWNTSELPVDLTPAFWPCCSLWVASGTWFIPTGPSELTIMNFYWLHSAPPIPFYNILGTVSVTLNWCALMFYLVAHISTFLGHLIYETFFCIMGMVCMILCILFKFWWLYLCCNIRWQLIVYWCNAGYWFRI